MKIYWSEDAMPELRGVSSEDRKRIYRATMWKALLHWKFWLVLAAFFAALIGAMSLPIESRAVSLVLSGLVGGSGGLALHQTALHIKRPHIAALTARINEAQRPTD